MHDTHTSHGHSPVSDSDSVENPEGFAFITLRAGGTLVAIEAAKGTRPFIAYCGPDLPGSAAEELALLSTRQHAPGGAAQHLRGSLMNELGTGSSAPSGFVGHRSGKMWATDLRVASSARDGECSLILTCEDAHAGVRTVHKFELDEVTGVLTTGTRVENLQTSPLSLEWCASLTLPFDDRFERILGFSGRWSSEFQIEPIDKFSGSYVRENKAGRTSHDCFPGLFAGAAHTSENSGFAAGFHLAWSGNSKLRVDRLPDGRAILQMGEMLFPAEIDLAQGEAYTTPDMVACWSKDGFSGVSQKLHRYLEGNVFDKRIEARPRKVHYNTWEAVYFDHSEARLLDLAEKAAEVGAERFVLDDGWFGGRRNDQTGLGDWWVSPDVYPDGLHTLVNRVRELGMEFGIWFEPEMVNPDSDLFRKHPDWVLHADGVEPIESRHQLTLDLTRQEVFDYLYEKIDAVVSEYGVDYIKWDMNRDTQYPGSNGRGAMHRQTHAVYALIAKLRAAHPQLEIESCSSGGARADYGVLRHTDRIWTSDNNDARHRHQIMRGASHFFPLSVLGNHIGPRHCHITHRIFSMEFRAASAIFGHMGMELDLAEETPEDRAVLARAIALHKTYRDLIHGGDFYRLEAADYLNAVGCVAQDKSEALFSCAQLDLQPTTLPARLRFVGLDSAKRYRVKLVWPDRDKSVSSPSIIDAADLLESGTRFTGTALMEHGMQFPLVMPDTCLIYHLQAEG